MATGGRSGAQAEVARRILDDLDPLVRRMGEAYRAEVPEYAALRREEMDSEVLPVSRHIVASFFRAIAEGREARVADVPDLERMGRRRLEMGVPLEPMLHVYRVAGRTVFRAVADAVRPGEEAVIADLGAAWMDYIDRASSVAASSYLDASHERIRRIDAHRGALLQALLGATDPSDVAAVAAEFAITLAGSYAPVLAAGERVSSRIDRLSAGAPAGTIVGFRGAHVVLLAPDRLPDLRRLRDESGATTLAYGNPAPPGPELAAELSHTEALVGVALVADRTGIFGPDDLLVDQLMAANPRVADALGRQVLAPVRAADRGRLLESTLRTYLSSGSIPDTAATELVHPNTVSYRLKRITTLTGLDPRIPNDGVLLALALVADRRRSADPVVVESTKEAG